MLDARRLHTFLAAATHGSFTGAAKSLCMTHSAVSQQMAILERELGLSLIERRSRGIVLTAAGRQLADRCTLMFGILSTIESEMRDLRTRNSCVRLAAFPTASAYLIPCVMRDFACRYPSINVEYLPAHVSDIPDRLRDGSIHVGLTWEYNFAPRAVGADIDVEHVMNDPLDVLLPKTHPLADAASLRLADLADERWILRAHQGPSKTSLHDVCRMAGFTPNLFFSTDDYQSIHGFVGAGMGLSLVPRLSLQVRHPGVVAIPIEGAGYHRRILVLTLAKVEPSDSTLKLIDVLREQIKLHTKRSSWSVEADPDPVP